METQHLIPETRTIVGLARTLDRYQLACHTCKHFEVDPDLFWCDWQDPNFPALCENYNYESAKEV